MFISYLRRRVSKKTPHRTTRVQHYLLAGTLYSHLKQYQTELRNDLMLRVLEAHCREEHVAILVAKFRIAASYLSDMWNEYARADAELKAVLDWAGKAQISQKERVKACLSEKLSGLAEELGTNDPRQLVATARELEQWNALTLREARRRSTTTPEALRTLTPKMVEKTIPFEQAC
jgi:hypothetical protein